MLNRLDAGERRARALPTILPGTRLITNAELAPFGEPGQLFTSVDSPDDLAGARRQLESSRDC